MIKLRSVVKNDFLKEEYVRIIHSSGLRIFLIKKDMATTYAIYGTNFGSMDNKYYSSDDIVSLPDGIAHFLEHKMFEEPDGSDAFTRFSVYGANANAYTTFDKTCYLFSCTDNFIECLEILLDFVNTPVFNNKSVEKEKGIITQEIAMGDDDPNRCVFQNMIEAMYSESSIAVDVAGTVESISKIDENVLHNCYNLFYTPKNMSLCICGNFDENQIIDLCDKILNKEYPDSPTRFFPEEKRDICKKRVSQELSVAIPLFSFGFKGDFVKDRYLALRRSISLSIATKAIFGRSSLFFEKYYSQGTINKSFSVNNFFVRDHIFGVVEGSAPDPDLVYSVFLEKIDEIKRNGICKDDFERAKKALYSNVVMSFDSTEEIANNFISFAFEDNDFFDYPKTIIDITLEEAYNDFIELYDEKYSVISLITPEK